MTNPKFNPGDVVWIRNEENHRNYAKTYYAGYIGPFIITANETIGKECLAHVRKPHEEAADDTPIWNFRLRHDAFMTAVYKAVNGAS